MDGMHTKYGRHISALVEPVHKTLQRKIDHKWIPTEFPYNVPIPSI